LFLRPKYVIICLRNKIKIKIKIVKLVETKIYLRFISWFIGVSVLPLIILFIIIYFFDSNKSIFSNEMLNRAVLIGIFISLSFTLLLSLIATRYLSKLVTKPIKIAVIELNKVVATLTESIQNILYISDNNKEVSDYILKSSKDQNKGLIKGHKAVKIMLKSLNKIFNRTSISRKNAEKINKSSKIGKKQSNIALDNMNIIKQLNTENEVLNQSLKSYTSEVEEIAQKVVSLSETARFLSLNASIEANKTKEYNEEFTGLVNQIRELNIISEQAALGIQDLANNMQKQIDLNKKTSIVEKKETAQGIFMVGKTIKLLQNIAVQVGDITKGIKIINKETDDTYNESENINIMIENLENESKSLVKQADYISQIINKQLVVSRKLNNSSFALRKVNTNLNNLLE